MNQRLKRSATVGFLTVLLVGGPFLIWGGSPDTSAAVQPQTVQFACSIPSLTDDFAVPVTTTVDLPGHATLADTVDAVDSPLSVHIPSSAVGKLRSAGAATLSGGMVMTANMGSSPTPDDTARIVRTSLSVPNQVVPTTGDIELKGAAKRSVIRFEEVGRLRLWVDSFTFMLTWRDSAGKKIDRIGDDIRCRPAASEPTELATVDVTGEHESTTAEPSETPTTTPPPAPSSTTPAPSSTTSAPTSSAAPVPPTSSSNSIPPIPAVPTTGVMLPLAYTLHGANFTLGNKQLFDFAGKAFTTDVLLFKPPGGGSYSYAVTRIAPVKIDSLMYRMIPLSLTVSIYQDDTTFVHFNQLKTYVHGFVGVRVSEVKVDGVPLNVGSDCRTSVPGELYAPLTPGSVANPLKGFTVSGTVDIPPFRGCGVTESYDQLLTNAISGAGNPTRISLTNGTNCLKQPSTIPICNEFPSPYGPGSSGSRTKERR